MAGKQPGGRPLSPHLGVYKWAPSMAVSIFHRITGDGLAIVGALMFLWWLGALEFAVQVLRVREIVVMGHGMCGGCQVALTRELHGSEPGQGGFIAEWIALLDAAR